MIHNSVPARALSGPVTIPPEHNTFYPEMHTNISTCVDTLCQMIRNCPLKSQDIVSYVGIHNFQGLIYINSPLKSQAKVQ